VSAPSMAAPRRGVPHAPQESGLRAADRGPAAPELRALRRRGRACRAPHDRSDHAVGGRSRARGRGGCPRDASTSSGRSRGIARPSSPRPRCRRAASWAPRGDGRSITSTPRRSSRRWWRQHGSWRPRRACGPRPTRPCSGCSPRPGLRISEALRMTPADTDLVSGVLTIRATKFRKSRLVPRCTRRRSPRCGPMQITAIGWRRARPRRPSSRRHAAPRCRTQPCARSSGSWGRAWDGMRSCRARGSTIFVTPSRVDGSNSGTPEGVEVAPRVAALATYLGHAKVSDTYWYLTGTPSLLALAARRFEAFGEKVGGA
jgi:integrase